MAKGGFRAGAGRKRGAKGLQEQEIQKVVRGVTDFVKLSAHLYRLSLEGNMKAAELLLAYGFGKPVQTSNNNTHVDITVGFDKPQLPSQEPEQIRQAVSATFTELPEPKEPETMKEILEEVKREDEEEILEEADAVIDSQS